MTGPEAALSRVLDVVERVTGYRQADSKAAEGVKWYRRVLRWEAGPSVSWDHRSFAGSMMVDLSGAVCAKLGLAVLLELARELRLLGFRGRRVDVRSDLKALTSQDLHLIDDVASGCHRGELCGFRVFEVREGPKSRGVTMGNRGSVGGGKYVRIYDKGLETRSEPARRWERVEVELTGAAAEEFLGGLLDHATGHDDVLAKFVWCGAVFDFREAFVDAGGELIQRSRRPRCVWWLYWASAAEVRRFKVPRRLGTLAGKMSWVGRSVAPALVRLADAGGMSIGQVVAIAIEEEGVLFKGTEDAAAVEFREWLDAKGRRAELVR